MRRLRFLAFAVVLTLGAAGCQHKLHYGDNEIVYEGDVKKEEAKALGDYLQSKEYFNSGSRGTVKMDRRKELSHSPPTYRVTLILKENAWNEKPLLDDLQRMADEMVTKLFGGHQTILILADKQGREQKKLYGKQTGF